MDFNIAMETGFEVTQAHFYAIPGEAEADDQGADDVYMLVMIWASDLLPNYPEFNRVRKVAYGYDINRHILMRHAMITFGYFLVLSVMGYFVLRTREFAA